MSKHKLKVSHGTDELNYADHRYRVSDDDTVEVDDDEAAESFVHGPAGVVEVDDSPHVEAVASGFVRVRHADVNAGTSLGERQSDGSYLIDARNVSLLAAHGFTVVEG